MGAAAEAGQRRVVDFMLMAGDDLNKVGGESGRIGRGKVNEGMRDGF